MSDEVGFYVSCDFPDPVKRICAQYRTKLSVSRVIERGVYLGGYADAEAWVVSMYVIDQVCRVCGLTQAGIGSVPQKERCLRHAWDEPAALLLFHAASESAEEAMKAAGEKAEQFNRDPRAWCWEMEQFVDKREYLARKMATGDTG